MYQRLAAIISRLLLSSFLAIILILHAGAAFATKYSFTTIRLSRCK